MLQLDFLAFTHFDLLIITIIAISTLFGLFRGLIKSSISLIGWIVSFILAVQFSDLLIPVFEKYTSSKDLANTFSIVALFVLIAIIIAIINSIIVALLAVICGGIIDRSLGLFFGFVRGCFLVSFAFYFMIMMWPALDVKDRSDVYDDNTKLPKWAQKSESLLLLAKGASFISQYMPKNFEQTLNQSFDENQKHSFSKHSHIPHSSSANHNLLRTLPKDFLDDVDEKDILTLHDPDSSNHEKVHILEKLADKYERYHGRKIYYGATEEEIQKHNQEHHKIMKMIESEIQYYNSLITNY